MTAHLSLARRYAALGRRLAAMVYDGLLLLGLMILPTLLVVLVRQQAITPDTAFHRVYQLFLLLLVVGFYVLSWTRRRQTAGMQAWQLRVVRSDGSRLDVRDALLRFAASLLSLLPLGLGYLWIVFDRHGLAWHDRLTRTQVEYTGRA